MVNVNGQLQVVDGQQVECGLEGVRVLDMSTTLPGPYCSQLLRRLGADVISIEPPEGDSMRSLSAAAFGHLAAGKQSVRANFKDQNDREMVLNLSRHADVVIEGWRPGVANRLGVGFVDVLATNPRVVYCSLTGYGQVGELSSLPGHEINYVAESGALDYLLADGLPIGDLSGGLAAALRVTSALRQVYRSGKGVHLDVSLTGALWDFVDALGGADIGNFFQFRRWPHYGRFVTSDGQTVTLGVAREDRLWAALVVALGRSEWAEMPVHEREARYTEVHDFLSSRIVSMSLSQVEALLGQTDTCWATSRPPGAAPRTGGRLPLIPGPIADLDEHGGQYRKATPQ